MERGIDHVVLCVNDLEAARDRYTRMGFTLTPTAHHPFGTANFLAQLQGCFLEVLTVADAAKIPEHGEDHFSFGAFNRDFLARGEGFSMLVFESGDGRADQAEFAAKGLDTYAPFDFSRTARLPDGSDVTVGFTLAFATHPDMPRAAYFCCQQHAPEHFWKPEYQRHGNSAQTVGAVILVAQTPEDFRDFFAALQSPDAVISEGGNLRVATARGDVLVLTPASYERRYGAGTAPGLADGPVLAATVIDVERPEAVALALGTGSVPWARTADGIAVLARDAFGTLIEFRQKPA